MFMVIKYSLLIYYEISKNIYVEILFFIFQQSTISWCPNKWIGNEEEEEEEGEEVPALKEHGLIRKG